MEIPGRVRLAELAAMASFRREARRLVSGAVGGGGVGNLFRSFLPFPAVRRVMGLSVIITMIVGRVASRAWLEPDRARYFRILVPAGVALGLVFYGINFLDARADKEMTRLAAQNIRQEQPGAKIWFMGAWGFGYYAGQAGMDDAGTGVPRAGDWLVYNRSESFREQRPVPDGFVLVKNEQVGDWFSLQDLNCFSAGRTAIEHQEGPRSKVDIYRYH